MHKNLLFIFILINASLCAQNTKVSLSGRLNRREKFSVIHLKNIDGIDVIIPVDRQNKFSFVSDNIPKGFYEVDEIGTMYFCPGYKLTVDAGKDGAYFFSGIGALENNALQTSKKQIPALLKLNEAGELDSAAYSTDVPVFLQKLDSFQNNGAVLFNKSTDTFFRKYATPDLEFNGKRRLYFYFALYGMNHAKLMSMSDSMKSFDPKSPDFLKKITSFMASVHIKEMNSAERQKLSNLLYKDWDKNNEMLFRNSLWYREAFKNFFTYLAYNPKYFKPLKLDKLKREDGDINKLAVVNGEISNPYILSYFNYTLTSSILETTKDTTVLNRYYKEFMAKPFRKDYVDNIKEIYLNKISYGDNTMAPAFSYKNVSGNDVTLESLRGKYLYIDVWATWCGPCNAEIPHLKKVEAAYADKNIEFISISVDEQKNLGKWKAFIQKNKLSGIQLITDNAFATDFIRKMGINSIPRFILIDPFGKIISADALRPSDNGLRTFLDALL